MPRKKATETEAAKKVAEAVAEQPLENVNQDNSVPEEAAAPEETPITDNTVVPENVKVPDEEIPGEDSISETETDQVESDEVAPEKKQLRLGVLKLNVDEETRTEMNQQELTWNELANANRSKKIISAVVTGLESTQLAGNVVVAYYKEQRIIVPMSEMMIDLTDDKKYNDGNIDDRLARICNTMLGAEIDVVIKGMDKRTASVVASRKDAMLRKRRKFYMTPLSDGLPQIREGRIVEGRIIAVTPMVARIELFGVEVSMSASQLSWDWVSDVSDKFFVGDKINVLIEKLEGDSIENLKITPNVKSLIPNTSVKNLEKCAVQGKYIGEITNVHNGVAYLRLQIGVNAIAHTNYDKRAPGKGDVVSFVITRINHDYGNVSGVITRIIKQHI